MKFGSNYFLEIFFMNKQLKSFFLIAATFTTSAQADIDVTFPDAALTQCLQDWAKDPINNYESLADVHELSCANRGITSLAGIEQLPELLAIDVSNNPIADYSPLAAHKDQLGFLWIWGNTIKCTDLIKLKGLLKRTLIGGVDFDSCVKD